MAAKVERARERRAPKKAPGSDLAGAKLRKALLTLADEYGVEEAAKIIGCGREAFARVTAGLPVRAATVALATMRIDARKALHG